MSKFLSENSDLFIFIIIILETLIAVWAIVFYIRNKKKTLYSFKNASLLGGSIFMVQMRFTRWQCCTRSETELMT